jgi:FxLD family lantipeptide
VRDERRLTLAHPTAIEEIRMDGTATLQLTSPADDQFDLDISVLESGDGSATLINLTDDGCKPSCKGSCATNVA